MKGELFCYLYMPEILILNNGFFENVSVACSDLQSVNSIGQIIYGEIDSILRRAIVRPDFLAGLIYDLNTYYRIIFVQIFNGENVRCRVRENIYCRLNLVLRNGRNQSKENNGLVATICIGYDRTIVAAHRNRTIVATDTWYKLVVEIPFVRNEAGIDESCVVLEMAVC